MYSEVEDFDSYQEDNNIDTDEDFNIEDEIVSEDEDFCERNADTRNQNFGRRITDMKQVEIYGQACPKNSCENPNIVMQKELHRRGLASRFLCRCIN